MSKRPSPDRTTLAEHAGALLSLQLKADEPARGAAPSDEELALLSSGQLIAALGHRRYQEILSHLNGNDQLMARWLAVCEAQQTTASDEPPPFSRTMKWLSGVFSWRWSVATATGILALVLLLVLDSSDNGVISTPPHRPEPYASVGDRSLDTDVARGALAALARLPQRQRAMLLENREPPASPASGNVERPLAYQYGELLTRAYLDCRSNRDPEPTAVRQISQLQSELGIKVDTHCDALQRQWQRIVR